MIGKILRTMRKNANLTQKEISSYCNLATTTLSGYESGYREPTFESIEKIANACGYEIIFINKKDKNQILSTKNINRKEL